MFTASVLTREWGREGRRGMGKHRKREGEEDRGNIKGDRDREGEGKEKREKRREERKGQGKWGLRHRSDRGWGPLGLVFHSPTTTKVPKRIAGDFFLSTFVSSLPLLSHLHFSALLSLFYADLQNKEPNPNVLWDALFFDTLRWSVFRIN